MLEFAAMRILRMLVTILEIVTALFFDTCLSGDALDFVLPPGTTEEDRIALTACYGLDGSIWQQYLRNLGGFSQGELGISFLERRPVAEIIAERIWPSQ